MMLYFNPSKVPSMIISESYSVMTSHSVEPNMSSSSIPSGIPILSNRYCHELKGDIGAWPSSIPSKIQSREPSVSHSLSPSMMLSFNPSKCPYLIPSVSHSDISGQIY